VSVPEAARPRFSLIVPAYNEEALLPRLLDSVAVASAAYAGGPGEVEVVVADNCSTDATARIARERGCVVVPVEKRVIAAARNGGARAAAGSILCFVDADSRIHPDTFDTIERVMASGRYVAGATGVTLERWSLGLAATYLLMVSMVVALRMDTGVVFCRSEDFAAIGGYDEGRLYAEDVVFLWTLRRLGRTRGQRLVRATTAKAVASTRKFDQHGDWHYFRYMPLWAWRALRSRDFDDLARTYWYEGR
jgi:glycosyltransferase involved in cell wall biosynthesis